MEEDKFKTLFSDFEPELTSDFQFMNRLRRNLNSVELIKRRNAEARIRSKKAVVIAAVVGFIVGFLFSLSLPYLAEAVSNWRLALPGGSALIALADNFATIAWLVIGATSVFIAINTYELSLTLMTRRVNSNCSFND